jgi:hypothetical protein
MARAKQSSPIIWDSLSGSVTLSTRIRFSVHTTDHIVIFGERHLRHVLLSYMGYYNGTRTHLSLNKDAPISRAAENAGRIICRPILGGLHHQYGRM